MANLTMLPQVDHDKFAAAVEGMRRQMPTQIEYQKLLAHLRREAFKAYLAEGFNEAQALELCAK